MSRTLDYSPTEGDNRASCRYAASLWTTTLGEDTWHISSWLIGKDTRLRRWRQKGTDKQRLPDRGEDHPAPSVESWQAIAMQRASGQFGHQEERQQKSEKLDGALRSMSRSLGDWNGLTRRAVVESISFWEQRERNIGQGVSALMTGRIGIGRSTPSLEKITNRHGLPSLRERANSA